MITIRNVKTLDGQVTTYTIPSSTDQIVEAEGHLLLLPGLIDPHICLGPVADPSWHAQVEAAVAGGITAFIDVPRQGPYDNSKERLKQKRVDIEARLKEANIPAHAYFYTGLFEEEIEQIGPTKPFSLGLVLSLSSDFPNSPNDKNWDRLFQLAAWENMPVVLNVRNEQEWYRSYEGQVGHSLVEKALYFSQKHNTRLIVLNISSQEELRLIEEARKKALLIYGATTPQKLYFSASSSSLWEGIEKGTIEIIGSGYGTGEEFDVQNSLSYLRAYASFLLDAVHHQFLSIEKMAHLTLFNIEGVFALDRHKDVILVDQNQMKTIVWTDNQGKIIEKQLRGKPIYTILKDRVIQHTDNQ